MARKCKDDSQQIIVHVHTGMPLPDRQSSTLIVLCLCCTFHIIGFRLLESKDSLVQLTECWPLPQYRLICCCSYGNIQLTSTSKIYLTLKFYSMLIKKLKAWSSIGMCYVQKLFKLSVWSTSMSSLINVILR